jgi:tetratricopeptide (TPR) repeat protein
VERLFVSREKELGRLGEFLTGAVASQGRVCFVTGEAGFGKTSLVRAFARKAQLQYPDLLVAAGACDAQTGLSDPYLPFRELLGMLTGEVNDPVATGVATEENAKRLQDFLRASKNLIAEIGPDLVDIFLPGAGIVTKAGSIVAGERKFLRHRSVSDAAARSLPPSAGSAPMADQTRVFEQVTAVLLEMAKNRPLVLILDDVQWIDESSASLLFHLGRRVANSRILVICTYRSEELAFARSEWRHPLPKIVAEIKRQYGDVAVVLGDETVEETRRFIDALVDSEPNLLGAEFRQQLHERTRGHPLFATELLRNMQERGDLLRDDSGRWNVGATLDWDALPAKVEGVLEERIARVRAEAQELLTIASVEGETFTAQVVSRLRQLDERQLLRILNLELDQQHRLVSEAGIDRVGTTRISQFRFRHQMFRRYFYDALGVSEREMLHEDVASVLEALYAGKTDKIAVQLAHHYDFARLDVKAAGAYLRAGRVALAMYANREALRLAERGLDCLNRSGEAHQHPALLLDLHLLRGEALRRDGHFVECMVVFRQAAELALAFGLAEGLAQAALGYDEPRWRCNLDDPYANTLLRRALDHIGPQDSVLRVYLLSRLVRGSQGSIPAEQRSAMLDEAVDIARRIDDPSALVEPLRVRISTDRTPERIQWRIDALNETLQLAERIGDRPMYVEQLNFRIYDLLALGDAARWSSDLDMHERLAEEVADPFFKYLVRSMRVAQPINAGRFAEAERLAGEAHAIGQPLGVDNVDGVLGMQMFTIRREQGRLKEVAPFVKHFVEQHGAGAAWRPGLALIYADLGQRASASAEFERLAVDDFRSVPADSLRQASLCYLAEVCDYLQDVPRAAIVYDLLRPYAELTVVVGNATVCLGATARFLGQLAATMGKWDVAEAHFAGALELNSRMTAVPWIAHTLFQHSRMLMRRGRREDAERAVRMLAEAIDLARPCGMYGLLSQVKDGAVAI